MKKVLNITMQAVNNYGSAFQSLATEYIFRSFGYECETIDFTMDSALPLSFWQTIASHDFSFIQKVKRILLSLTASREMAPFVSFRQRRLHLTKNKYLGYDSLRNNPPVADIYCTGSDQVWNPIYQKGVPYPFLLDFVPDNAKKIALSASFGVEHIDDKLIPEFKRLLSKYSAISVRESSALKLLNSLGIEGKLVLDPTLIVGKEFWNAISAPRLVENDYVFVYQLGHERDLSRYALRYAKAHDMKLVRACGDWLNIFLGGEIVLNPSPEEILSLFKYAKYVITNSFHAIAMSLLFERQFIVRFPSEYSTRLQSILELTNLSDVALIRDFSNYAIGDVKYDYSEINRRLDSERENSLAFLKSALFD